MNVSGTGLGLLSADLLSSCLEPLSQHVKLWPYEPSLALPLDLLYRRVTSVFWIELKEPILHNFFHAYNPSVL